MKLEIPRQIFGGREKKKLKYQVPSKPVQWEPSFSMRMDRETDE
jgi:hypothetical protein